MPRRAVDPQKVYGHLKNKVQWAVCDKCGWHWPEDKLHERGDGRKICPNHPDQRESTTQKTARIEKAAARIVRRPEPIPKWPSPHEMRDVVGVTEIVGMTIHFAKGSETEIPLVGRNLSAADVIGFADADSGEEYGLISETSARQYTAIDPETRGNTASIFITDGSPPIYTGWRDLNLIFNGDVFPRALRVYYTGQPPGPPINP